MPIYNMVVLYIPMLAYNASSFSDSKVTVKTFIILQNMSISNKCCSFELSFFCNEMCPSFYSAQTYLIDQNDSKDIYNITKDFYFK